MSALLTTGALSPPSPLPQAYLPLHVGLLSESKGDHTADDWGLLTGHYQLRRRSVIMK